MVKKIMIGYPSNSYEIADHGLEDLMRVIKRFQTCPNCEELIDTTEHQLVGKKCLACVLLQHKDLTFHGFAGLDSEGREVYTFTNSAGITFTSTANSSEKPYEDVALSIEQAGFHVPTSYKPFKSEETIQLERPHWHVFGKLAQSVVLLQYKNTYQGRNGTEVIFIAYKGGQTVEFNKRTTDHKNKLESARNLAERTKKGGYYHLPSIGYATAQLWEEHLYPIIATLESAVWDAQLAFIGTTQPEEPEEPEGTKEQEDAADAENDLDAEHAPKKKRGTLHIVKETTDAAGSPEQ